MVFYCFFVVGRVWGSFGGVVFFWSDWDCMGEVC